MSWSSVTSYLSFNKTDYTLLAVRLYTMASTFFQIVLNQSVKSSKFLADSFKDDTYMFMNGSFAPVPTRNYNLRKTGSSVPVAFYNRETKTLSKLYSSTNANNHTLDIYTAQLFHGEMMIYDLTDFFETTLFADQDNIPDLSIWLGAWSLENEIYLDPSVNYVVKFQTLENTTNEFNVWSKSSADLERWQKMNQTVPRLHRQTTTAAPSAQPEATSPAQAQNQNSNATPVVPLGPQPFDENKTDPYYEEPASVSGPVPEIQLADRVSSRSHPLIPEAQNNEVQPANA